MKKANWLGAVLGAFLGLMFGFVAHDALVNITGGLWSVKEGAPWIAIYAVIILPVFFGFAIGLSKGVIRGLLAGAISPFVTAFIDYFTCLIIGIFASGSALTLIMSILILSALLAGPGRIIVLVFTD